MSPDPDETANEATLDPSTLEQAHLARLFELEPEAATALAESLPELRRRLPRGALARVVDPGIGILERNRPGGLSYFRLESAAAQDWLAELETEVRFEDQRRVLALFAEAIAGVPVPISPRASTAENTTGRLPSSDGSTLYLPESVQQFDSKRQNFLVYKAAVLHQTGYYKCDTFGFDLARFDLEHSRKERDGGAKPPDAPHDEGPALQRFFERFDQPHLARRVFSVLEATRIDAFLLHRYRGFRSDLLFLLEAGYRASKAVPSAIGQLERAAVRSLLERFDEPFRGRRDVFASGDGSVFDSLLGPAASVYDSARLTIDILSTLEDSATTQALNGTDGEAENPADHVTSDDPTLDMALGESGESGDEALQYRGELDPELIQKRLELDQLARELASLDPEALSEGVGWKIMDDRLGLLSLQDGDLFGITGMMQAELEDGDAPTAMNEDPEPATEEEQRRIDELLEKARPLAEEIERSLDRFSSPDDSFYYDEWDHEIGDYRRDWCRLSETVLGEADYEFVEKTRQRHAELLSAVRRQFEMLRPEVLRRVRRLVDGEELDLDRAVEVLTDLRAGLPLSDDVYTRRNRQERDVSAIFLLDLSASTDTEVEEGAGTEAEAHTRGPELVGILDDSDPWEGLWGFPHVPSQRDPRRRVVDVEKEAVLLMADALETLGDRYAVYGFSGYGRDKVDLFVAKEFDEAWTVATQKRLAAMEPYQSTRMGPAIRHCLEKLHQQEARVKVLLILSDGYPQDHDYGPVRGDRTYGLKDTMMALREAQLQGVHSFCLTVDPAGYDYLREMCPEHSYLVIDDVESLPDELPKVYRGLTT